MAENCYIARLVLVDGYKRKVDESKPVVMAVGSGSAVRGSAGFVSQGSAGALNMRQSQRKRSRMMRMVMGTKKTSPRPSYPEVSLHTLAAAEEGQRERTLTQTREMQLTTKEYSAIREPSRCMDES